MSCPSSRQRLSRWPYFLARVLSSFLTNTLNQTVRSKVRVWLILSSDLIIIHVQPSFIRFLWPGNQRRHFYIFLEPPLSCCGTHFPITTKNFFLLPPKILTYLTYLQNSRSITYLFWWILEHKVLASYEYHTTHLIGKPIIWKTKNFYQQYILFDNFNIFFRTLTNIWETLLKSNHTDFMSIWMTKRQAISTDAFQTC